MHHFRDTGWGRRKFFEIAMAEDPETGFVKEGKLTIRVTIKADPVLQLCVAASTLQFNQHAFELLEVLPADVLSAMLASDSLGIASEEELLGIVTGIDPKVIDELLPAVRLKNIPFKQLLSAAKASACLQQSTVFKDSLKKLLKENLASSPSALFGSRGGSKPSAPGQQRLRGTQALPVPPEDRVSLDALVAWISAPALPTAEQLEMARQLDATKQELAVAHAKLAMLEEEHRRRPDAVNKIGEGCTGDDDSKEAGVSSDQGSTKQCGACSEWLPLGAFSSRQWNMELRQRRCAACIKAGRASAYAWRCGSQ